MVTDGYFPIQHCNLPGGKKRFHLVSAFDSINNPVYIERIGLAVDVGINPITV